MIYSYMCFYAILNVHNYHYVAYFKGFKAKTQTYKSDWCSLKSMTYIIVQSFGKLNFREFGNLIMTNPPNFRYTCFTDTLLWSNVTFGFKRVSLKLICSADSILRTWLILKKGNINMVPKINQKEKACLLWF